jgi:hypothetical protein
MASDKKTKAAPKVEAAVQPGRGPEGGDAGL